MGVKYVTDINVAVFFIDNDAIVASNENIQLQQLNAYNSMLDIRLDGNCFTASFSHNGVKRIVENKIQNILPKSKSEAKAGFGSYIQADSTIL